MAMMSEGIGDREEKDENERPETMPTESGQASNGEISEAEERTARDENSPRSDTQDVSLEPSYDGMRGDPSSPTSPEPKAYFIGEGLANCSSQDPPPGNLAEYLEWGLQRVGSSGPFQTRYNLLLGSVWAYSGAQTMIGVFTAMPAHRRHLCPQAAGTCHNEEVESQACGLGREEWEFVDPIATTVTAEFALVCESSGYVPLLGTLFFLGFLFGVYIFGSLADTRGRRFALFVSWVTVQVGGLSAAMAPTYAAYAISRMVTGFGVGGMGLVSYVWNAEFLGAESRSILVLTTNTFFALGMLSLPFLSYIIPEWRRLSLVIWLMGWYVLGATVSCIESPKWLVMRDLPSQVHGVLNTMASTNGKNAVSAPGGPVVTPPASNDAGAKVDLLRQLLFDRRLSTRFSVMCFAWFALSLGYYGLSMNVASLGPNVYMSSAIASLVEIPACFLALRSCDWEITGRRGSTGGGLVLGGLCCILSVFVPGSEGKAGPGFGMLFLVFLGKFAVALSFASVYLFAAELFPTSLRSRAMGLQSLASRIGGMAAPMVADLGHTSRALPLLVFGLPCLVMGVVVLAMLPETRGMPMMDTIDDVPVPARHPMLQAPVPRARKYDHLDEENRAESGMPRAPTPHPQKIGACSP